MSTIIFNEHQMKVLENNQNVDYVSERSTAFTLAFKIKAVNENLEGKAPS